MIRWLVTMAVVSFMFGSIIMKQTICVTILVASATIAWGQLAPAQRSPDVGSDSGSDRGSDRGSDQNQRPAALSGGARDPRRRCPGCWRTERPFNDWTTVSIGPHMNTSYVTTVCWHYPEESAKCSISASNIDRYKQTNKQTNKRSVSM